MAYLKFALDEDVSHHLAGLLRSRGWDADSARELGRLGLSDVQVLLRAAEPGQTLITHNLKDFEALHEAWVTWRRRWSSEVEQIVGTPVSLSQHAGILMVRPIQIHELAKVIEEFADSAASMDDRLLAWNAARRWHEPRF